MQDGFFQKLTLAVVVGACLAGLIEFYALNGAHPKVHMTVGQPVH